MARRGPRRMRFAPRRSGTSVGLRQRSGRVRDEVRFLRERARRLLAELDEERNFGGVAPVERASPEGRAVDAYRRDGNRRADAQPRRAPPGVGRSDRVGRARLGQPQGNDFDRRDSGWDSTLGRRERSVQAGRLAARAERPDSGRDYAAKPDSPDRGGVERRRRFL